MATPALSIPKVTQVPIKQTKILIDNQWVDSLSGKTFETIDPATGEVIARLAESDAPNVDLAVKAARKAFHAKSPWRRMAAAERGKLINRLADLIEKHQDRSGASHHASGGRDESEAGHAGAGRQES